MNSADEKMRSTPPDKQKVATVIKIKYPILNLKSLDLKTKIHTIKFKSLHENRKKN